MSGFDDTWLALREPADHAARNRELEQHLNDLLDERQTVSLLDLGAGTGSNLRHLSTRLNATRQVWTLIDNDPNLLDRLPDRLSDRLRTSSMKTTHSKRTGVYPGLSINDRGRDLIVNRQQIDLANGLASIDFANQHVITGSAVLDLAGADWLAELAERCVAAGSIAYFVLSYDGRSTWSPAQPDDDAVLSRFNRHQKQDKGLGVSLGPDAAAYLIERLRAGGYTVMSGFSDWTLTPEQGALQQELDAGISRAVGELDTDFTERARQWGEARQDFVADGVAECVIGHLDILAAPARQGSVQPCTRSS